MFGKTILVFQAKKRFTLGSANALATALQVKLLMANYSEEEMPTGSEPAKHHRIEISKGRTQHCYGMSKMTVVDDNCNNCK